MKKIILIIIIKLTKQKFLNFLGVNKKKEIVWIEIILLNKVIIAIFIVEILFKLEENQFIE